MPWRLRALIALGQQRWLPVCRPRNVVLDHAANAGLLMLQAGPEVLRLVPSPNISDDEVADGLQRWGTALRALSAAVEKR